jgi:hypothetical protein
MSLPIVKAWKFDDPIGQVVAKYNCKEYDRLYKILKGRCKNCGYVCSSDPNKTYAIAGMEPVCALCHEMYKAITFNPQMKNMNYFRDLHEKEEKEKEDNNRKRRRMGLDENEGMGT